MAEAQPDGYRASHQARGYAAIYGRTFQAGYYAALWNEIEKPLLERTLRALGGSKRSCLDFACGTGRITQVAATVFDRVVGVDVSKEMLASASANAPPGVSFRCIDITREPLPERFDVATAFRFFLNAEDELRGAALRAIHRHLHGGGRLVCNVHMNATSPMGMLYRALRARQSTLSLRRFRDILAQSGFSVESVQPYGYLPRPGPLLPGVCETLMRPTERLCRALHVPARFAQNFLVVAGKRENVAPFC